MKTKSESVPDLLPEEKIQLRLQRYLELCRQNVAQTEEATKWLRKHGLEDLSLFERYSIGWSDGSLGDKLPNDPKVREELRQVGLLGPKDRELFEGHALFTVFGGDGRIQNIWAVGADGLSRFLPNRPRGPWNLPVTKHSRHVFVVADPVSALVLVGARYASVLAVDPESGVVDADLLKARGVQRISIIAGDTREASKSARVLVARFSGIPSDVAVLTGTAGVREFLRQHTASELSQAVTVACAGMQGADIPNFLPTPDGFRIRIESREYFAIRLMRAGHQLKTTLRAHCRGRIHVDTLDLYGSRARKEFIREAARIFEEPPRNLEEDLAKLLAAAERRAAQPDLAPPDEPVDPVPEALRKEAEVFGQSADLIARIREHLTTLGVEGEDVNKTVAYLGMTSRLLTQPLAIKIWGSFGTGKSAVMQGVAALCPPEHHFPISYLSAKALLHMERDAVKGKFMTVAEAKGAEDSAYLLRELISSGRLIGRFTDRDSSSGKLYTKTTEVEGPTAVMVTDADVDPDEETGSRFIVLCSDESRTQTQRILQRQRAQQALAGLQASAEARRIRDLHHAFQRLLQPLTVVIPEGLEVPESDDRISSRRDWPKIANLMKAMALLRQMQKVVKQEGATNYIEVDSEDVRLTLPLIDAVFRKPMRELSDTSRNLIQAIHELRRTAVSADAPLEAYTFSMRQVREYTRLPQTTIHRCKGELLRYEFLIRAADSRQRPFRYWLDWASSPDRGEDGDST